jgi:EAL domain-containing protein (putative c-di-GMP-specific phosphodiesterase class I)/GGDEF domain-containing protein
MISMSPSLQNELLKILDLKLLTTYFQPIISLNQRQIMGYEALIRGPSDSPLHSPFNLFDTAERYNLTARLEFLCREITIASYADLHIKEKLFINVTPTVLLEPEFKTGETLRFIDQYAVDPQRVVIELTEHQPTDDYPLMLEAVKHYRNMGFEIALDDLGAGYSGLRLWSELLPEYVKIDKHFIQNLHEDPVKLNFVRSIQDIAGSVNCKVIAEGIETKEEFMTVEKLGITHGQGYYFARPSPLPVEAIDSTLFVTTRDGPYRSGQSMTVTASHIIKNVTSISSETPISRVLELFQQNNHLTVLPLVDNNLASGIIYRDQFLTKLFSSRFGLELYGKKAIHSFLDNLPFFVDQNAPLAKVSTSLTTAMRNDQAFIITSDGEYAGIGTLLDLLENITQQQLQHARHANPLTLLPGSVPINDQINQLLANKSSFSIGYFDLDNFKPFNDVYGYSAGDDMIKAVANILLQHISIKDGVVGHIGGDDFIVIFTCAEWLVCCESILKAFESIAPGYYHDEDVKAGGIFAENRTGEKCFFPLVSLSIGLISPESASLCHSHVEIADLATSSKKMAKKIIGNSYFIEQRKEKMTKSASMD